MAHTNRREDQDTKRIGRKGHHSWREELSQAPNTRDQQDRSLGGRGDIANKEQGIGKGRGKSFSRGKKKQP
jgi:hypothetical protein